MKRIELTKGLFALVDDGDYEILRQWKWHAAWNGKSFMAARRARAAEDPRRRIVLMHRQILSAPSDLQVDHANHDTLDNQRANIRLCTQTENNGNLRKQKNRMCPWKGVVFCKYTNRWRAIIKRGGIRIHIGRFDTAIEAAEAYNEAAKNVFGQFAFLNEVPDARESTTSAV